MFEMFLDQLRGSTINMSIGADRIVDVGTRGIKEHDAVDRIGSAAYKRGVVIAGHRDDVIGSADQIAIDLTARMS